MARSIRKKRISETKKELKQKYRSLGSSRRDARRMAAANAPGVYEAEREKKLAENRAKREARRASMASKAKSKKAKGPGKTGLPDVGGPVKVGGKTYSSQAAANAAMERKKLKAESETTKRGLANMRARRSVGIGETYERTEADGTKRKMVKRKQEEDNKAKHGGALAIMIAPVIGKKMKAIKKGAHGAKVKEAMYGAKMKKAMYGAKMKKAEMGAKLKEVPSDNKGLSKLPKKVRNKMGYMKNGGKVTDPKKKPAPSNFIRQSRKEAIKNIKAFGKGKGRGTGLILSDAKSAKDAYKGKKVDMVNNVAKNPMPKKGPSLIEKAQEAQKKSRKKMMYGGAMKKAMYGAKMKKKAMYGASMKKKAMYGAKMKK